VSPASSQWVEEMIEVDDGARLWSVTEGTGIPVVLCHGGPGDTDNLGPVSAMIADLARVHRHEQRACGRSSGSPPFTMARSIADLEALRSHWGHDRWVVAGHSFGAALALAYALEHPVRTTAVVYGSCVVRLKGEPDWHDRYREDRLRRIPEPLRARYLELRQLRDEHDELDAASDTELRRLGALTEFANPETAERLTSRLIAGLAKVNHRVNRELGEDFVRFFAASGVQRRLQDLDVPVLLVHGAADPRPIDAVETLAAELPRARLVRLEGVGHFPWWEAPDVFRDVLRKFLGSLAA
jgi:proline iminopeptidase